ncbi:MAG: DUF4136 domain-containing protein [Cyclobacteriaceae bacterium]|nr:DUF4136 domain-containing protein [Cyclobacteriaceae bacterium]
MKSGVFIMMVCLALIKCMPIRVTTEKIEGATFLGYETYNFYDVEFQRYDSLPYTRENMDFLLKEIREQMLIKGFDLSENPDLLLNVGVVVKQQEQTRETDPRFDMNYIGQRTYHWERKEIVTGTYEEGAITIDFVDAENNRMIWQGTAVGILTNDLEKMRKRASYAIEKIFSKMPLY